MNRNLSIFLGAVALAAAGTLVGRAITADDLANAAPRDFAITRKGNTAKVEVLCVTKVTAEDGGVAYDVLPQGSHTETMAADDGGTETTEVRATAAACRVEAAAAITRLEQLFGGEALTCYRRGVRLER